MQATISCVQPPTTDTLQTLHSRRPKHGTVLAACNLQKAGDGSLDGVVQRLDAAAPLADLQGVTAELFGGTSVVRCTGELPADLGAAVASFASDLGTQQQQPALAGLVPLAHINEFFFIGQELMSHADARVDETVRTNAKKKMLAFYDLFDVREGQRKGYQDCHYRDGALWAPMLSGGVAVVRDGSAGNEVFLVCWSGVPHFVGEVVHAVRADLDPELPCETFATSKELWFLRELASRNRRHMLAQLANDLGVQVPLERDTMVHDDWPENSRMMAVETYAVLTEDLVFLEHAGVVEHRKGCVPVAPHQAPVPVWLGDAQGLALWSVPEHVALRMAAAPVPALFPCTAIPVQSGAGAGAPALRLEDLAHLVDYGQVELSARERALVAARDALGMPLVVASQNEPPLPIVLHPAAKLAEIESRSPEPTDAGDEPADSNGEIMQALCRGLHSVVLDGKVKLCASAGGTRQVLWNAELARFFATVLDAGVEALDIRLLRPMACALSEA